MIRPGYKYICVCVCVTEITAQVTSVTSMPGIDVLNSSLSGLRPVSWFELGQRRIRTVIHQSFYTCSGSFGVGAWILGVQATELR